MAVEFSVEKRELVDALRLLFASVGKGKGAESQYLDMSASDGELALESQGFGYTLPADVRAAGSARIPFPVLSGMRSALRMHKEETIPFSITDGRLTFSTTTLSYPEISLRPCGTHVADLPIDASLRDVLLVCAQFTPEQIDQSGLTRRVSEARHRFADLIGSATNDLALLGITQQALSRNVLLSMQFTPEQIEKSGLIPMPSDARDRVHSLVENAAKSLEPLGITREALLKFALEER